MPEKELQQLPTPEPFIFRATCYMKISGWMSPLSNGKRMEKELKKNGTLPGQGIPAVLLRSILLAKILAAFHWNAQDDKSWFKHGRLHSPFS